MSRLRGSAALVACLSLIGSGCGDALSSMTQHWFYGYVTSVDTERLCLSDARTEDVEAERCFELAEVDTRELGESDLVKVRYERADDDSHEGHGGGTAVAIQIVRKAGQSDG